MHLTLSTSFRQLRTYWLMSCAALFGFWLINPSSAQAQCSACIGDRVVRVLAFNITDCDDGLCGDPDPDISLNGNLFSADGVCGIWDQPTDPIIVTSTSNSVTIAVVANEDDSGGLCAPDDAVVSTTWTIDLSTPAFGQTQTFNDNIGGNDYDFTIFYDVICEGTTSPILLDLQTDYPNYCGEPLFISASINEPLADAWSANNGLVELVFDPAPNSFPQNPYSGGVTLLGAFDALNSGGGGFSLESGDFDAPDHSGNSCNVESYTIYAKYNTAIAATLGLSDCQPWVSTQIHAWPDPATIIANGFITAANINITYSGCTAFLSLPPGCDGLQITPTEVNLAPGQTSIDIILYNIYCGGSLLTVPVQQGLTATADACTCNGTQCSAAINVTTGSGNYDFVALNGTMVGTDFVFFDGEYSGFVQVTDNVTGCQELVTVYCEGAVELVQAANREILGLQAIYCADDPTTTLYDERLFDNPALAFPVACPDGGGFVETYSWSISSDGGTTFAPANGVNGLEVPAPTSGTALFQPTDLVAGQYIIRYCVDLSLCNFCTPPGGADDCTACIERAVYVYPSFDPTFTLAPLVCGTPIAPLTLALDNEAAILAELATLAPIFDPANEIDEEDEYIRWSGNGVTDDANGPGGTFATATPGVYTITVEVGYPACSRTHVQTFTVVEEVNALVDDAITLCSNAAEQFNLDQLYLPTTTQGGTWSIVGVAPPGVAVAGNVLSYDEAQLAATQTITLLYAVGDVGGTPAPDDGDCYGESNAVVTLVLSPDSRNFDLPDTACSGGDNLVLSDYIQPSAGATGVFTSSGILAAGNTEFDLTANPPGSYTVTYTETNGVAPNTCENIITEVITVGLCTCPEFTDMELSASGLCEDASTNTTATVFMDAVFSGAQINFGATPALSPIANPYDTPPAIALGFDGALVVSGAAQATLTFDNTDLGAAPVCQPTQYVVYAYLDNPSAVDGLGACEPFVMTTVMVYPNPADVIITTNTNECITTFTTSCPEFEVTPSVYVASPGDAAIAIFPISIDGGLGNPCADFATTAAIPACDPTCPDLHDLQATDVAVCGDGAGNTGIDLTVYTSAELLGTDITFGYSTTLIDEPNTLPASLTVVDVDPVSLSGTQYVSNASINLPDNTTCNPIDYIVYAFVDDADATAAGLTADCRPVAVTTITVYPDPSAMTIIAVLNTTGEDCTYQLLPLQCPGFFVYPSTYTANPGDPLTTISVLVTNSSDSPCGLSVTSLPVDIPACDACEIGFDLPDTYCANEGILDLNDYTAFTTGTWALVSGAGTVTGSDYDPAGVVGSSLVHLTFTPDVGAQCGVTVEHQYMTVYEGVDATLQAAPSNLCMFSDTPFDLTLLYGPGTTLGGIWTATGPDGVAVIIGTDFFDPFVPGWYQLVYSVTNGTCTDSDNFFLYVHPPLDATINDVTVCESPSGTVNLSAMMNPNTVGGGMVDGTTVGGVWAYEALGSTIPAANVTINNDVLTYTIPSGLGTPYTIAVSYTVTGEAGAPAPCDEDSEIAVITITGSTETGFDLPDVWCGSMGDMPLNPYTTVGGGTWTVVMVSGDMTDPLLPYSVSGPNAVIQINDIAAIDEWSLNTGADSALVAITYQPAAGGCGIPITEIVEIHENVDPSWTNPTPVCEASLPLNLSALVTGTTGGVFSGPGVYLDDNGTPADPSDDFWAWDPAALGLIIPNSYDITYTVGFGQCQESETHTLEIYPTIADALNSPIEVCESPSGTVNLEAFLTTNLPDNGTWTIVSHNLTIAPTISGNVLSYLISPADVAPYIINISYDLFNPDLFPEGTPCNPTDLAGQIIIYGASEVGFDLPDTWCVNDGVIDLTAYTATYSPTTGGVWSLETAPETSIGTTYTPQNGDGLIGILYTPGPGGCGMPHVEYVNIIDDADPFWINPSPLCQGDLPWGLEALEPGGIWSGPGVNEFGMFGIYPQGYVMDFGSGTIIQSNGNDLYQYEEDGMFATVVTPPAFSATNRFRFLQSGAQTDIEFGEEGMLQATQTNVTLRFDYSEPFQLTYLQMDATGLSGGFVVRGYDSNDVLMGTVTVPENPLGGGTVAFGSDFYGISYFTITNTSSSTLTTRTRIEEIGFNDLSNIVAPGFYPITYTVGEFPCEESLTQIIEVVPIRSADIRDITVCQSPSGTADLTAMQLPTTTLGGTFTVVSHNLAIDPVINNNTLSYQISFSDVPPYQITIQYALDTILNVFNPGDCNPAPQTAVLTITNTAETGFDLPDSWCVQDGAIYLPTYTQVGGGTYSLVDNPATAFDESEIPLIGDIYIPQNGDGLVGITYTPIPGGCGTPNTDFVDIVDDWNVTIDPVAPICPGADPIDLNVVVSNSVPYPQGYTVNYLPSTTVEIPAGTTIQVSCGDGSVFCFVPVTNVATSTTINYNNFTTIPYATNTTVSFPNGAIVTYTVVTTSGLPTVYTTLSNNISGQLISTDATAARPSGTGTVCNTIAGTYRYDVFEFQVSATGNYTFISNFGAADGYAYVTQVPFAPGVCGSGVFVAKDDNSGPGSNPQFGVGGGNTGPTLSLSVGVTYQLITTTVAQNAPANYSWAFSGAGNVLAATPILGEWSGVGIIDELTGWFDPAEAGLGEHLITYTTYNGACLNQDTIIILVGDTTVPNITCPANIEANTISCSAFVNVPNATATDNCPGPVVISYVAQHPDFGTITSGTVTNINQASNVFPAGLTTITWTATDVAGNTATCATEILVRDSADPVIFCQQLPSIAGYTSDTLCGAEVVVVTPVAYDNCGLDSLYFVAIHTTDANGDPIDTDPVLAGNQADTIYMDGMAALINGGSNTTDIASGIYPGGVTLVTWTVTDVSGRSASCTITVTVIDDDAPIFVYCPDTITSRIYRDSIQIWANGALDTTVYAPPTGLDFTDTCVAVVYWDLPLAIDNCSEGIDPNLITIFNAEHDTLEGLEPILLAATQAALQADANSANAHFICDFNPSAYCVALLTTTEADSIAAHNQLAAIVAAYNQAHSEFQQALADLQAAAANASINYTSTHDSGDIFALGDTPVTYTATDGAGNSSNCTFIVTVEDHRPPEIFCPAQTVFTAPALADACYGWIELPAPSATDNCSLAGDPMNSYNWGHVATDVYPLGQTVVVWTATDGSGNTATCSYTVNIVDQTPPEITWCQPNVIFSTEPGLCSRDLNLFAPLAIDSCSNHFIVTNSYNDDTIIVANDHATLSTLSIFDTFNEGITEVTWFVSDTTGNISTCTTIVRIDDLEAPTITCPANITIDTDPLLCTPDNNSAFVSVPVPTIFADNCGVATVVNSFNSTGNASGIYPVGVTEVTWIVTDVNGRQGFCTMTITVVKCCQAEAGMLAVNDDICPGDNITAATQGNNTTAGYQTLFLATNATTGQIVAINDTGVFPTLGTGLAAGTYVMYAYNVKTTTALPDPEPSVGMNIAQIGTIAVGCFDLSNAGVTFIVPQAFPVTPIMNIVSQGSGGASPFYYDVVELTVAGGTMPYHFAWDNEGYIRYDIAYEQVDTNGDGTPDTPGATITIMTADNATWDLLVSDAFGCTAAGTQFSNDPNGINDMLDIVNYVVGADNGTSTGSVDITAAGGGVGCAPYSYAWSGPDGFTATTEDLNDVPFGWYTVTVTCADGSQNTIGWYWVPITHRGRTKTEGMTEGIATYPNPVQSEAIVEFYVQTTGKTTLTVFAADGKQVSVLFDDIAEADLVYELPFSATHLAPGMYTVVMNTAAGSVQHSKVIVTK